MSTLIVANIAIENPATLGAYQEAARASMKEYGIRLLGKAGPTEMLEGKFDGVITVVLEADSVERAREWHGSPSYQKAIAKRSEDAKFTMAIVPAAGA